MGDRQVPLAEETPHRRRHRHRRTSAQSPGALLAALDLGTNTCRMMMARPAAGGFRVVGAFSRIVRLGEGLSRSGTLSETAMSRALAALAHCAEQMEKRGVTRTRAVATEACRRARNGGAFCARVQEETGIELEVISNQEEAGLGLAACVPLLDPALGHALVLDIGGGSTQISWMTRGPAQHGHEGGWAAPRLSAWCSIPLGVVTLSERYGDREASAQAFECMIAEVQAQLAPFESRHGLAALAKAGEMQMLGTSGTATTLAGIHQNLPRYRRDRIDGCCLDFQTVALVSRRVAAMSPRERMEHPCIGDGRADLVVAGCAILQAICRTWPVGALRVADRGLREGILMSLLQRRVVAGVGMAAAKVGTAQ